MKIPCKLCKGKYCFGMVDLPNSTKNLSVNYVALCQGTVTRWEVYYNDKYIAKRKFAMKVTIKHKCKQIAIQRKSQKYNVHDTRKSMLYISEEKNYYII